MIDWEKVREEEYPWLASADKTFLDAACVGIAPRRVVRAVQDYAEYAARNDEESSGLHHGGLDAKRAKAYQEAAKLLNADIEEIALVENTSHGLNIAATSIPLEPGDNIVTTNCEFIQVALPWCAVRRKKEIEIREVVKEDYRFEVEDFAAVCDEHTKAIVLSSVEWSTGWKMDLKSIGDFCKEKGIFLVVDMVQQFGTMKIDTKEIHVDFMASGCHKWLNSPFGAGVLYINKETQKKVDPVYWGYANTVKPAPGQPSRWENPAALAVNDWVFERTAKLYETGGTANYPGAVALGETLGLINELGIENVEKKVMENVRLCIDGFRSVGGTLITHDEPEHLSAIVVGRLYQDLETERLVMNRLLERKIFISLRFTNWMGGFRVSCHYFNNKKDFDVLFQAIREIIAEIGREPDFGK
ncbi:aminotransferase class V-fold PLP-dependent enzyme [Cuneatibacter sp. NSJ-177]|uniref:aminotransferase class V-fold PLP-dependent enzyme n=1 Tax=Cuneatibacter sp. NSJ-177 TaxID=2931401 RepID=UPI001FD109ED|nr:aminotransferase class V-fold PLP-dependent enzyme [Cuneatibacter sp. NSJ-177]MCJ7837518.1 aminotransferase class V-fold PLP-dependent enzyme [Cuneatibacter sp. NSJ-177]